MARGQGGYELLNEGQWYVTSGLRLEGRNRKATSDQSLRLKTHHHGPPPPDRRRVPAVERWERGSRETSETLDGRLQTAMPVEAGAGIPVGMWCMAMCTRVVLPASVCHCRPGKAWDGLGESLGQTETQRLSAEGSVFLTRQDSPAQRKRRWSEMEGTRQMSGLRNQPHYLKQPARAQEGGILQLGRYPRLEAFRSQPAGPSRASIGRSRIPGFALGQGGGKGKSNSALQVSFIERVDARPGYRAPVCRLFLLTFLGETTSGKETSRGQSASCRI
ncbi:hypothetical protein B0T25DRAFT_48462 [Lasiosphaeria hispida]|uniref:Uncharacterized protein n=1 Tax=Lasiosphaeria hispida TaxID=260671 RepID=A0AAJ0HVJ0_9PEZI|nr:hypothetical protein B0T25DRAFT_48462 [Lasiosphaeria hispida]